MGEVFHKNVYGADPPEPDILTVPVLLSHRVVVDEVVPDNLAGAGAMKANAVAVHPLESVTE